jgi:hypothetical protein
MIPTNISPKAWRVVLVNAVIYSEATFCMEAHMQKKSVLDPDSPCLQFRVGSKMGQTGGRPSSDQPPS